MEFSVVFDEKAAKELTKLSRDIRTRIFRKIIESKADPFRFFEELKGRKDYKLRVGNYRVIADINKSKKRIEITKINPVPKSTQSRGRNLMLKRSKTQKTCKE